MKKFVYKAKDNEGNTVSGELEAEDERSAAAMIRQMGCWPIEIRAASSLSAVHSVQARSGHGLAYYLVEPIWTGVNITQLAFFYRQLATLLGSGMTLGEALVAVGKRTRGRLGRIVREAAVQVQHGRPLSEILARYPRVFGSLQLSLLRTAESSGALDRMVDQIATYLEYELTIRRRIATATFYPKLLVVSIIFIPLLPTLVLKGGKAFLGQLYLNVGSLFLKLLALIIGLKLLFQFESTRLVWDFVKLKFPILGWTAHKIAMSRFCRALAILYSAGVPIAESVFAAADASGNVYLARKLKHAVSGLRAGKTLSESLASTRVVSPIVLDMVTTADKTGETDAILSKVADYMDEESDATLQKVGPVLFVVSILLAGIWVAFTAVQFYARYFTNLLGGYGQ
jgi:type II secretory pathway component PulF